MKLSKIKHLSREDIIKNGSIFTPYHIVKLAKEIVGSRISKDDYIIDFGVGYGAFISEFADLSNNLIATDSDSSSIELVKEFFPFIKTFNENSLKNISREKYGLNPNDKLIIIGNPPYNDLTSQYKKGQKGESEIDENVVSRDLGISFLKMYALLDPEYICVLHPLSYLIKFNNFRSLGTFNDSYVLEKGIIFSSNEFESIKKTNSEFPVLLALYTKSNKKIDYTHILNFKFDILCSTEKFVLNNYKTIDGIINKYPRKNKKDSDLQFYTLRDINALKRNKTFLVGNNYNGVKVEIKDLYKYAWLDYFKNNFKPINAYLYGNLSPLYSNFIENEDVKKELISYVLNENLIVKKFIADYDLMFELEQIYGKINLESNYYNLKKIISHLIDAQ